MVTASFDLLFSPETSLFGLLITTRWQWRPEWPTLIGMPTEIGEVKIGRGCISTPGALYKNIPSGKHVITWCTRSVKITMPTQSPRRTAPEHRSSTGRESANFLGADILLNVTVSKETLLQGIQHLRHNTHDETLDSRSLMGCPIVPLHPYVFMLPKAR